MIELNKVYCMDALELLKQLPDKSVDLVLTDPPYFFEPHDRGFAKHRKKLFKAIEEIGVNHKKNPLTKEMLSEFYRVCKKEKNILIFCNKAQILEIINFGLKNKMNWDIIPLCKTSPIPFSNNQWLPDREWAIHLSKDVEVFGNYSTKQGFFIDSNYQQDKYDHPTSKPEYMIRRIIKNLSKEGMIVLDCFIGSGTTAACSKQLGRNFIGCDINQKYVDMTNKRLAQEVLL